MQLYIFSKDDLELKQVSKISKYSLNFDEETNNKSEFVIQRKEKIVKGDFLFLSGAYKDFYFIVDDILGKKEEQIITIMASDISNIFNRKIIEKNIDDMTTKSLEQFIGETINREFVTTDPVLAISYIDISMKTQTKVNESTNSENMIYNFHTFLINCRQNKNIFTNICVLRDEERGNRLQIDIEYKELETILVDTTLSEVVNYNKIYEVDPVSKVTVFCRDNNSEYNLYLKSDNTTTTNINDSLRVIGRTEVISVDEALNAANEALNIIKGNRYKHLVEFDIKKSSKLVDTTKLEIGTLIKIKTEDDIYSSYISAIIISDNEFISYKTGSLRVNLIDKLKQNENSKKMGNKIDLTGGTIKGDLDIKGDLKQNGITVGEEFFKRKNAEGTYSIGINKFPDEGTALDIKGLLKVDGRIAPTELATTKAYITNCEIYENLKAKSITGNFPCPLLNNVNLNNYKTGGTFYFVTGCTNAPASYFMCNVIGYSANDCTQMGLDVIYSNLYMRTCANNVWSSWKKFVSPACVTAIRNRSYFNFVSAWTVYNIGISSIKNKVDERTGLTFTTQGIKITSTLIKAVKVSALFSYNESQIGGDKLAHILKNGVSNVIGTYNNGGQSGWKSVVINEQVIPVVSNDVIGLGFASGQSGSMEFLESALTVEAIY